MGKADVTMSSCRIVQCRHLFPALTAWAAGTEHTTANLIVTRFSGHGCYLTTERSFVSQATSWVTDVLTLFFKHIIHWCLYNLALADVRSTGAGIKCVYCTFSLHSLLLLSGKRQIKVHLKELKAFESYARVHS